MSQTLVKTVVDTLSPSNVEEDLKIKERGLSQPT